MGTVSSVMAEDSGPSIARQQAGGVSVQRGTYELTAAQAEDATLRVRLCKLPAGHRIVDLAFENDDLDSGATGVVDIGVEDTIQDPSDSTSATLFAADRTIQAAGIGSVRSQAAMELGARNYDRYIIMDIATVADTGVAGGVAATLTSRPALTPFE